MPWKMNLSNYWIIRKKHMYILVDANTMLMCSIYPEWYILNLEWFPSKKIPTWTRFPIQTILTLQESLGTAFGIALRDHRAHVRLQSCDQRRPSCQGFPLLKIWRQIFPYNEIPDGRLTEPIEVTRRPMKASTKSLVAKRVGACIQSSYGFPVGSINNFFLNF